MIVALSIAFADFSNLRGIMTRQLRYGTTAKLFHWLIVLLLFIQYPIGCFMPDVTAA
jgi:hypothetical protein